MITGNSTTFMCMGCGRKQGRPWGVLRLVKHCGGCKPLPLPIKVTPKVATK